jgi:hypothetical protein
MKHRRFKEVGSIAPKDEGVSETRSPRCPPRLLRQRIRKRFQLQKSGIKKEEQQTTQKPSLPMKSGKKIYQNVKWFPLRARI